MKRLSFTGTLIMVLLFSCNPKNERQSEVREDTAFKAMFYSGPNGVTGADGIFSVPLNEDETVFFLGDCFLGKVTEGSRDLHTKMLRNSFLVHNREKSQIKAIHLGTYDNPETLMNPVNEEGDSTYRWYWPGHGFRRDSTLYVFALNLYNEPSAVKKSSKKKEEMNEADILEEDMMAFRISQIDLMSFSLPGFRHIKTWKTGFNYAENPIDFGNCVMVDDGFVYIYGTKNDPGISKVHVARIPFDSEEFHTGWEYSTGEDWSSDIKKSVPIEVDISVSEQFSIFRHGDTYVLLTQERAGTDIFTYTSSFPNKDFQNKKFIYHTPDHENDPNKRIHAYNALAHPQYIEKNELLVSYCVNSISVGDVFDNVDAYRARFIRVPIEMILNEKKATDTGESAGIPISAADFTRFFARDCCGLTGADGLYSVLLPDGRTVWMFGDTFLGTVNPDKSRLPMNPVFVRNTVAIQDGDSLRTLYNIHEGSNASYFIAREAYRGNELAEDSVWFWPGDAFMENGKIKFFLSRFFKSGDNMWGFRWGGTYIATVSYPGFEVKEIVAVSYPSETEIHWGHAVCDEADGYTYIYGTGEEHPYVARAPKANIHAIWEFYTGEEWVADANLAKSILEDKSSEQFSVFRLGKKYILLTQTGDLSKDICTYNSELPYGDFSEKTVIARAEPPSHLPDSNLFTYNALAHPQFLENDKLLVSYCVNSFNLKDLFNNADNYRPVFLDIPIQLILTE